MLKLTVQLLRHTERRALGRITCGFTSAASTPMSASARRVLRRVIVPSPDRVNPVHLFAAYLGDRLVGGACTLVLPAFSVVFGSYIFVDPALRGRGLGMRILRQVLRQERRGPQGWNWRLYAEVTVASGNRWHAALAQAGFRFFPALVAARLLPRSRQSRGRQARLFPLPEKSAAPIFPTRSADVYPRAVLWSGFDASPLAAASQRTSYPWTHSPALGLPNRAIGSSVHRVIGSLKTTHVIAR